MKCPLLCAGELAVGEITQSPRSDCLQKECAWWNNTNGECAILQLSKSIYYIGVELAQMEIKMPHLEQFKRP